MMNFRGSGVLLHITSLPSRYGIGDFGPGAYQFADFLARTKQHYWQVLPLNPALPVYGNSPYSSTSAFAGNIYLISPELLAKDGLLPEKEIEQPPAFSEARCEYEKIIPYKQALLDRAYTYFIKTGKKQEQFEEFCVQNADWLNDYVLFMLIKRRMQGKAWNNWPKELIDRRPGELHTITAECSKEMEKEKFLQYLFYAQWHALKAYCNSHDIQLIGDIPIYVSPDSADVWSHPDIFKLNSNKKPAVVAGVPPDYFSKTGQLWGNPVYNWDRLKKTGFAWWIQRMAHMMDLFDAVRIDHFRGLVACWEVPAGEATAINGQWATAPVYDFFDALLKQFLNLPVIAEDLGLITDDVKEVLKRYQFPGMKVLLFAFGEDNPLHPYLPHNYEKNYVVYTGTHDNNTARGWFENEATDAERERLFHYTGRKIGAEDIHREIIRLAMMSVANTIIIPLQDILGLGEDARMNIPSVATDNWQWRLLSEQLTPEAEQQLLDLTELYGRA